MTDATRHSSRFKVAGPPLPPPPTVQEITEHDFIEAFGRSLRPQIEEAARKHGVDPKLLDAMVYVESKYDLTAKSHAGAAGLLQLTPITQREVGITNPHDVKEGLDAGAKYVAALSRRFKGNLDLILAAFNAGPTVVAKLQAVPQYEETINYIKRVKARMGATGGRKRTGGTIEGKDSLEKPHAVRIDDVKPGDRVRFKETFEIDMDDVTVRVAKDELASVESVNTNSPYLTVRVVGVIEREGRKSQREMTLDVTRKEVEMLFSPEDPRVT